MNVQGGNAELQQAVNEIDLLQTALVFEQARVERLEGQLAASNFLLTKIIDEIHAIMPGISTDPSHPLRKLLREYE